MIEKAQFEKHIRNIIPEGFTFIFPIISGIMISFFKINKTYKFWAILSALDLLLALCTGKPHKKVLSITLSFDAMCLSLWVAQIYMIIKWFKGKELSLAFGFVFFSDSIARGLTEFLDLNLKGSLYPSNLPIIEIATIPCFFAIIMVFFLNKLDIQDTQAQVEERLLLLEENEEKPSDEEEDSRSVKPITIVLMGAIVLFWAGDYSFIAKETLSVGLQGWHKILSTWGLVTIVESVITILLLLVFGYLVDKKGKRIPIMLLGLVMLFLGNASIILAEDWDNTKLFILTFVFREIGANLFQVSSWACLGLSALKRVFGIVLGLTYGLMAFVRFYESESLVNCVIMNVLGMVLVILSWILNNRNEGNLLYLKRAKEDIEVGSE